MRLYPYKQIKKNKDDHWSIMLAIIPEPKQSVRIYQGIARTSRKKQNYVDAIRAGVMLSKDLPSKPMVGPLEITIHFGFPLFDSDKKTKKQRAELEEFENLLWACSKKNDLDNLMKPVADALNGVVIVDDGHICKATLIKVKTDNPFIDIEVKKINDSVRVYLNK